MQETEDDSSHLSKLPNLQLEFGRNAMACQFQVLFNLQHPSHAPELAVRALDCISALEQVLSVYIPDSELSRINRQAISAPFPVSKPVGELIEMGLRFHKISQGAFDLTAASLSQAWGFSRRQGRMPTMAEIEQALDRCGSQKIQFHSESQSIQLRSGVQLNPGGIGKGYALDQAAQILTNAELPDFLIHGGLSSALGKGNQHGSEFPGWRIAVRHPYRTDTILGEIRLQDQAIGTSGAANQFFYFQGKRYGHIIDPRTGWPAQHWLSVTVVAPTAAEADAIATSAFVMSQSELDHFAAREKNYGIVAIREGKRVGDSEILVWNLEEPTWMEHSNR